MVGSLPGLQFAGEGGQNGDGQVLVPHPGRWHVLHVRVDFLVSTTPMVPSNSTVCDREELVPTESDAGRSWLPLNSVCGTGGMRCNSM